MCLKLKNSVDESESESYNDISRTQKTSWKVVVDMLLKLAAARIEAGYKTKKDFVGALNEKGLIISKNTYNRFESGTQIADVVTAFFIADCLKRDAKEIFLPLMTRKMSRECPKYQVS